MRSKTIAEALADALPVDGTRGCTAHAAGACGATERTVDGGGAAMIPNGENEMDMMNNMNVDSSPPPSSISRRSSVLRSICYWRANITIPLSSKSQR